MFYGVLNYGIPMEPSFFMYHQPPHSVYLNIPTKYLIIICFRVLLKKYIYFVLPDHPLDTTHLASYIETWNRKQNYKVSKLRLFSVPFTAITIKTFKTQWMSMMLHGISWTKK